MSKQELSNQLVEKMQTGVVVFKFISQSAGGERLAVGTLRQDLIDLHLNQAEYHKTQKEVANLKTAVGWDPEGWDTAVPNQVIKDAVEQFLSEVTPEPKVAGKSKAPNPNVQTYYDLQADGFRSYSIQNLVAIL